MLSRICLKVLKRHDVNTVWPLFRALISIFSFVAQFTPLRMAPPSLTTRFMGLSFPNPVGLAAGFDKTGSHLSSLRWVGFGFIEIGTINIDASSRNIEMIAIQDNLKKARHNEQEAMLGVSLGSLRNQIDQQALLDFITGMETFFEYADFLVINLSRPNTQIRNGNIDNAELSLFFSRIKQHQEQLSKHYDKTIPVLAKLAVDHQHITAMDDVLIALQQNDWDGVILAFENWSEIEQVATYLIQLKKKFKNMTFIAVGGIRCQADCQLLLNSGASMVQLYTALVENGPWKTRQLLASLSRTS